MPGTARACALSTTGKGLACCAHGRRRSWSSHDDAAGLGTLELALPWSCTQRAGFAIAQHALIPVPRALAGAPTRRPRPARPSAARPRDIPCSGRCALPSVAPACALPGQLAAHLLHARVLALRRALRVALRRALLVHRLRRRLLRVAHRLLLRRLRAPPCARAGEHAGRQTAPLSHSQPARTKQARRCRCAGGSQHRITCSPSHAVLYSSRRRPLCGRPDRPRMPWSSVLLCAG